MICITYYSSWSDITAVAKLLATACLLLAAMYLSITVIAPLLAIIAVAAVKTITVAAIAASPLLIIKLQKVYRL